MTRYAFCLVLYRRTRVVYFAVVSSWRSDGHNKLSTSSLLVVNGAALYIVVVEVAAGCIYLLLHPSGYISCRARGR